MNLNCPIACEVATAQCVDKHNDCPGWTVDGECDGNRLICLWDAHARAQARLRATMINARDSNTTKCDLGDGWAV